MLRRLLLLSLLLSVACGDDDTAPMDGGPALDGAMPDGFVPMDTNGDAFGDIQPVAVLAIHALDLWAQPLIQADSRLTVTRDSAIVPASGWPEVVIPLTDAGNYVVRLESEGHIAAELLVQFNGGDQEGSVTVAFTGDSEGQGLLVAHGTDRFNSWGDLPTHRVMMGLRHMFFSAQGPPPRHGNNLTLFTNGEDAWASVSEALQGATDSVHMSSWWWESDFELVRPIETHASLTETERRANTVMGHLEATAATKRIMIGQFLSMDGILSGTNVDDALTDHGANPADDFEFMGALNDTSGEFEFMVDSVSFSDRLMEQADENGVDLTGYSREADMLIPSRIPARSVNINVLGLGINAASWHQKFSVMDNRIAFVGGMNVKATDWDTDDHTVWNFRRMPFEASMEEREAVRARMAGSSTTGPRKDYFLRIEGPSVQDANAVFADRWTHLIDINANYSANASAFTATPVSPIPGGIQAQVTATMPEPFWRHAIAESWFNAVESAEEYIFIEDQYFRVPMLVEVILDRMEQVPALELIVITKPVGGTDPGCRWTRQTYDDIQARFPARFTLLQLRAFDYIVDDGPLTIWETKGYFTTMDTHSKMFIVDDIFMSVGSANKNNRGIVYEGELNVAVYNRDFVRTERRRILSQILPPGMEVMDGVSAWREQMVDAASWNDFAQENWGSEDRFGDESVSLNRDDPDAPLEDELVPRGFIYSLEFSSTCLLPAGPDSY